jgi:hypothetical protein
VLSSSLRPRSASTCASMLPVDAGLDQPGITQQRPRGPRRFVADFHSSGCQGERRTPPAPPPRPGPARRPRPQLRAVARAAVSAPSLETRNIRLR